MEQEKKPEKKKHPELPVLVVDDDKNFLDSIEFSLLSNGITNLERCEDSRKVMPLLEKKKFSLILLDLIMPHISGKELLPLIVEQHPEIPVIVLTGVTEVETAVECMKHGASNYLTKPINTLRLLKTVQQTLDLMDVKKENILLKERLFSERLKYPELFSEIITRNREMYNIFKYIEVTAESKFPVLVTGESGTGKDLIAQAIHKASGRKGNLVSKKVGGLDNTRFSNELFGNEKEKGLFDQAKDCTLFLDEIADISTPSQVQMLSLIQEREYISTCTGVKLPANARVVAATSRDLKSMAETGEFRKDLYHRLQAHHIHLPPLRERKEDIPLLIEHFLEISAKTLNKKKPRVPREIFTLLSGYDFPGNLRELGLMIYDAVSTHRSGALSLEVFREKIRQQKEKSNKTGPPPGAAPVDTSIADKTKVVFGDSFPTLAELEEIYLKEALERADGDENAAADLAGITPHTFSSRLKKKI
jgi:DNA-binding NtrC family response regulator